MPGRIDGREDYLALVNIWADQLEPYTDEQVKDACHRVMGRLKRFPYPSDMRDELAPARAESTTVDTSQVDVALVKVGQLSIAMGIADAAPMDVDSKDVEGFMAAFQAALIPLPKCVADSFNHCLLSLLESARLEFTNSGHVVAGGASRGGVVLRIFGARELLAAALAAA